MKINKIRKPDVEDLFKEKIKGSLLNVDCGEISLKSRQFCNLTSINFATIKDNQDFKERAWAATFIGTLQSGYTNFHYLSSKWQDNTIRDSLLGVSLTGICDNSNYKDFDWKGVTEYINEVNKETAEKIGVSPSIRITCIKPEGCLEKSTLIRTDIGDLSLEDIFRLNGYTYDDIKDYKGVFLETRMEIFIYNENNELEKINKLFVNGTSDVYEIEFEDGLKVKCTKDHKFLTIDGWKTAEELFLKTYIIPIVKIKSISKLEDKYFTLDIETGSTHTYRLSNNTITHNTVSTALTTSSGIHARFAKYYIRRIRYNKNEPIAQYLMLNLPDLVEEEFGNPNGIVLSIPQKSPEESILRDETAIDILERVKFFHENWIQPCHHKGENSHNVSCTINIKSNEWNRVKEWMWNNRESYNGISVFPYDGGTYKQAPFEECTKEEYERLLVFIKNIDLKDVYEENDITDLKGELACSGNSCDIY